MVEMCGQITGSARASNTVQKTFVQLT